MNGEPRTGLFLCTCRPQMKERLDYEVLTASAGAHESVVHVESHPAWCLAPGLTRLREIIAEKELDRIIVAGCSFRTHRKIFADALQESDLDPYMLEIVNLRDQCAAVHSEGATDRALAQIEMAVAHTSELEPLEEVTAPVEQTALVIGGGLSGLIAAETLATAGCEVILVEEEEALGGYLAAHAPWKLGENGDRISAIISRIESNPAIETILSASPAKVDRTPGGFTVTIQTPGGEKLIQVGAIMLATGSRPSSADGAFGHNGRSVRTQEEFEAMLNGEEPVAQAPLSIVMIQCVGSRDERRPYCSRVCCLDAVENATAARRMWPDSEVTILFRDLEMGCLTERGVKHALDAGVAFHRFDSDSPPIVENGRVKVLDTMTGKEIALLCDLLVLSTGEVPSEGTHRAARKLHISADRFGFIPEPMMRLRPTESAGRGIYVTGSAHWPVSAQEAMYQAYETASRAAVDLRRGVYATRPIVASVDESKCIGCHLCESMCAWGAIRVEALAEGTRARVQPILCKGCGTCVASCPVFAIDAAYYGDEQVRLAIKAAVTS